MKHDVTPAPVFISEQREIFTADAASERLRTKNDSRYLDDSRGVVRVDRARWEEAQRYERLTWMRDFGHVGDDRNHAHAAAFDGYAAIRGRRFDRAIELGCGPFTNLRLIGGVASLASVDLLDPLIESYLTLDRCTYARGELTLDTGGTVPIARRVAAPIEEFEPTRPYALTVMINVIEHCFDAARLFDRVLACAAAPGSTLVFHDRYYHAEALRASLRDEYDAGHPLKLDREVIDRFLDEHFEPLFRAVVRVERFKWGGDRSYDGVHFIGTRKHPAR
jgi:hypothetical protein